MASAADWLDLYLFLAVLQFLTFLYACLFGRVATAYTGYWLRDFYLDQTRRSFVSIGLIIILPSF